MVSAGGVFAIVCDSQPGKMLVLDSSGKWLSSVKSVEMRLEPGQPALVTCVMYEGTLKPSKPQIKSWTLSQIKSVSAAEFQQMVDAVQSNPEAIKEMLKKHNE
jgi:hypothetical protein